MIETILTIGWALFLLVLITLLFLVLVSSLFHVKHMVPFVPTPLLVIDAMITEANLKPGELAVDLGAGDGRVLRRAMKRVPGIRATGYEGAFGVWLLAKIENLFSRHKPDMRMQDFFKHDFSDADVVFTYLSIDIMKKLLPKLEKELKPGARVVSHAFSLRERQPTKTVFVQMPFWGKSNVFVYHF